MKGDAFKKMMFNAATRKVMPCLFYGAQMAKRVPIKQLLCDSDVQADVLTHIAENYDVGAVIRMTELWSEASSFGADCVMKEKAFPVISKPLFVGIESALKARVPEARNEVTIPLIDSIKKASERINKPIIAGVTGPFTISSVLNGNTEFMMDCMLKQDDVHAFLEKVTEFLMSYIIEYKKAGAFGVMIAEPSIAMISPGMAMEFSNQYIKRIIEQTQDDDFTVIYHNCGKVDAHLDNIKTLDAFGYHFSEQVDILHILDSFPRESLIMGNVEPKYFASLTPEKMKGKVSKLLDETAKYSNFVLSSGCDIGFDAKEDTITAFCSD
jgi:uroporphyrinogen decarboxylase